MICGSVTLSLYNGIYTFFDGKLCIRKPYPIVIKNCIVFLVYFDVMICSVFLVL